VRTLTLNFFASLELHPARFHELYPEMNCYGLPENERAYYRLAHQHRTALNRVPYSQAGVVTPGCAPGWDGQRLGLVAWDRRFGPYFDGSAFADAPRKGVPLEIFYLPLHENWPSPMEGNYNGDYWADRAFSRQLSPDVCRSLAADGGALPGPGLERHVVQCFSTASQLQGTRLVARLLSVAPR